MLLILYVNNYQLITLIYFFLLLDHKVSSELPPITGYTGHIPRLKVSNISVSLPFHHSAKLGLSVLKQVRLYINNFPLTILYFINKEKLVFSLYVGRLIKKYKGNK